MLAGVCVDQEDRRIASACGDGFEPFTHAGVVPLFPAVEEQQEERLVRHVEPVGGAVSALSAEVPGGEMRLDVAACGAGKLELSDRHSVGHGLVAFVGLPEERSDEGGFARLRLAGDDELAAPLFLASLVALKRSQVGQNRVGALVDDLKG